MEMLILAVVILLTLMLFQLTRMRTEIRNSLAHMYALTERLEKLGADIDMRLRDRFPTSKEEEAERRRVRIEIDPNHAWDA